MKKLLLLSFFSMFISYAYADCNLKMDFNKSDHAKYEKYHGGPNEHLFTGERYDWLCEKFKQAHAEIRIVAQSTVMQNKSIGWAALSVKDLDTGIATTEYGYRVTNIDSYASQDRADQLMVGAILQGLQEWDTVDVALQSLENERKRTRAFLVKQK